jgi:hypothetical protein
MAKQRSRGEVSPALEVNRRHEQPRAPDGKFASPNHSPAAPEATGIDTTGAADATPVEAPQTPPVANEPPAFVSIPLPADHPLRAEGLTEWFVRPEQERAARALLNNPVRTREVQAEREARQAAERRAAEAEARAKAYEQQVAQAYQSPDVAARYAEIAQAWGPEEANRYLRGVQAEMQTQIDQSQREAVEQFEAQRQAEEQRIAGQQFAGSVVSQLASEGVAQWWLQQHAGRLLGSYGWQVSQGLVEPNPAEAAAMLRRAYLEDPYVKPHIEKARLEQAQQHVQTLQQKLQAEAEAKQKRELEELARAGRTNPLGRIPAAANTGQQALPVSVGPQSAREARELARNRARGLA